MRVEFEGFAVTVLPVTRRNARERPAVWEEAKALDENEQVDFVFWRYLTMAACEPEGFTLPLSLDEYLDLPEAFTVAWAEEFMRVNPHWFPQDDTPDDIEKKSAPVTTFTSVLPISA